MTTDGAYVELGFIADDRPGLLAMITAALAASRFQVAGAQVYSWVDTFGRTRALDLFWVKSNNSAESIPAAVSKVGKDFSRLLSQQLTPADLVTGGDRRSRWSDRPSPKVNTEINIDNRSSAAQSVIEVTTRDQPGLLFWLANTLQGAGLTISLAKINTEGTQVADVFYVTDADGRKITDQANIEKIKSRILSTIAQLEKMARQ
jgi:[protein-PII] uridylyltransferase